MGNAKVEEFLQPKSMLTPGIAGGVTMLIANTLWVAFSLPPRWTSLVLSFVLGFLVFVSTGAPLLQRVLYYVLNSLIIFSVSIGTNYAGGSVAGPPSLPAQDTTAVGHPAPGEGSRTFFGSWFETAATPQPR